MYRKWWFWPSDIDFPEPILGENDSKVLQKYKSKQHPQICFDLAVCSVAAGTTTLVPNPTVHSNNIIIYIYILYILYQCEKHLWYKWIVYHSVPWTIISIIVHVLHSNGKNFSAQWLAGSEQLQVLFQARVLTFQLFNLLHLGSAVSPWIHHELPMEQLNNRSCWLPAMASMGAAKIDLWQTSRHKQFVATAILQFLKGPTITPRWRCGMDLVFSVTPKTDFVDPS